MTSKGPLQPQPFCVLVSIETSDTSFRVKFQATSYGKNVNTQRAKER